MTACALMVCMSEMLAENPFASLCRYGAEFVGPVFILCQNTHADQSRPHQDSCACQHLLHVQLLIVWDPATQAGVKLISLPSKRLGLYTAAASTIIARSDSNGEDLEAFAGAGMSHSIVACDFLVCTHHAVHHLLCTCHIHSGSEGNSVCPCDPGREAALRFEQLSARFCQGLS